MHRLDGYLELARDSYAGKYAIITDKLKITYQELYYQVNQIAYFLKNNDISKSDRVIISLENSIEQIVVFFACLRIGAIPVLINPETPETILDHILLDLKPKTAFFELKAWTTFNNRIPCNIIVNSENLVDGTFSYEAIISTNIKEDIISQIIGVDLACIIYTSGSTGIPKGVMLSHRNMITAAQSINSYLQYSADDIVLNVLPTTFDYGLYQVILSIISGATLVLEKSFIWPPLVFKRINQYKVTILPLIATMIPLLFQAFKEKSVNSVKKITNTGTRMTSSHIETLRKMFTTANIYSMYGLTECKRCSYIPPKELAKKKDSIGIPIPNLEMNIIDENGSYLPTYTNGEIIVRSDTIMLGYWNDNTETNKKIKIGSYIGDRILYTGDIGYYDDDGYFYLTGRKDDTVKIRGMKVNLSYVEKLIEQCPIVYNAVVVVVIGQNNIEKLVTFVIFNKKSEHNKAELINFCNIVCNKIEIPEDIVEMEAFPQDARGKINKPALKAMYENSKEKK